MEYTLDNLEKRIVLGKGRYAMVWLVTHAD